MKFGISPRRPRSENIVPMINVVFLLLIFFLMTAEIAPRPPFEITPPEAGPGQPAEGEDILYVSQAGRLAYADASGEAVFAMLAARPTGAAPLMLRADAGVPAARIAALLPRLAAAGVRTVDLVTVPR